MLTLRIQICPKITPTLHFYSKDGTGTLEPREGSGFLGLVRKQKEQLSKGWEGWELSVQQEFLEKMTVQLFIYRKTCVTATGKVMIGKSTLHFPKLKQQALVVVTTLACSFAEYWANSMQIHHLVSWNPKIGLSWIIHLLFAGMNCHRTSNFCLERISGDELYVYPHLTRSGWHKI